MKFIAIWKGDANNQGCKFSRFVRNSIFFFYSEKFLYFCAYVYVQEEYCNFT